ncbi:MAG TPA: DUF1849 family protein [Alphaproteobacteria bacterium]
MKRSILHVLALSAALCAPIGPALALGGESGIAIQPHRALYDVTLTSIQSGGQLVDIRGKMYFEWKKSCDSWTTDHRSSLMYEYSDGTSARINSDFASYETLDGKTLNFSSKRENNGSIFEEYRGHASLNANADGDATYSIPEKTTLKLPKNTFFPMQHTVEILERAKKGEKFFNASLFDGSDDQGPQQVNVFIGGDVDPTRGIKDNKKIDASLLRVPAHKMRLAFFDPKDDMSAAEYEMDLVALDNGVVSDIEIIYDNFTIKQHLVALEKMPIPACTEKSSFGGE